MRSIAVLSLSLMWLAAACDGELADDCLGVEPGDICFADMGNLPPAAYTGQPPGLLECFVGDFFAICGGEGEPAFACSSGDCRWFAGGRVAHGYVASPCPAEDICCLDNYPYPSLEEPTDLLSVLPPLYSHGLEPWDRERAMAVTVAVDDGLERLEEPELTCSRGGESSGEGPCVHPGESPVLVVRNNMANTLFGVAVYPNFAGYLVRWEVDVAAEPGPQARVCMMPYTDAFPGECQVAPPVQCADAGRITLSRLPADHESVDDLALTIDAEIDGLRLELAM